MLNFGEKKIVIYATTKLNILNETKNHNPPPPPPPCKLNGRSLNKQIVYLSSVTHDDHILEWSSALDTSIIDN